MLVGTKIRGLGTKRLSRDESAFVQCANHCDCIWVFFVCAKCHLGQSCNPWNIHHGAHTRSLGPRHYTQPYPPDHQRQKKSLPPHPPPAMLTRAHTSASQRLKARPKSSRKNSSYSAAVSAPHRLRLVHKAGNDGETKNKKKEKTHAAGINNG